MLFSASGAPLALWHPRPVRSRALMRGLWLCLVEEIDFVSRPCSTPSAIPCSNSYRGRAQSLGSGHEVWSFACT